VSQHEPGHQIYWVKICSFCGKPDWDALDKAISSLLYNSKAASGIMPFSIIIGERSRIEGSAVLENYGDIRIWLEEPNDAKWLARLVQVGDFKGGKLTLDVEPARPHLEIPERREGQG
jgi:hypothetical protein